MSEWIPCSERLPEIGEYVLVTTSYGDLEIMQYASEIYSNKPIWKSYEMSLEWEVEDIIAWMPLPEPWEEKDNE